MSKSICITGMHRSGTSLTASWLQQCGIQIDDGELIGASVGNELGHFEDKNFVDFQAKRVKEIIPASQGWIASENKKFDFTEENKILARNLFSTRNEKYTLWGWKDPRSTLFLNEWQEIDPSLKFIIIWRSAHEVVASLEKRSLNSTNPDFKINKKKAYETWMLYNSLILKFYHSNQEKTLIFSLPSVVKKDAKVFNLIKYKFKLDCQFSSIKNVLNNDLFSIKNLSLKDRYYYWKFNIKKLEKRLSQISTI